MLFHTNAQPGDLVFLLDGIGSMENQIGIVIVVHKDSRADIFWADIGIVRNTLLYHALAERSHEA